MMRLHGGWLLGLLAIAGFVVSGCESSPAPSNPPADHGHDDHGDHHDGEGHEHPETYAAAVEEISELNEKIRDAFAKDDAEAAHDPLHEIGHLLDVDEMTELAEKAGLGGEELEAIKAAVKQLEEDFYQIDLKFHGDKGKNYSEVETQVGDSLATLKKYVPAAK